MVSPTFATPFGATTVRSKMGVFVRTIDGEAGSGVFCVSGSFVHGFGPTGQSPSAVAVLETDPALMFAWVKVYTLFDGVQFVLAPGANEAIVQVRVGNNGSVTTMFVKVTLPVFCTLNV